MAGRSSISGGSTGSPTSWTHRRSIRIAVVLGLAVPLGLGGTAATASTAKAGRACTAKEVGRKVGTLTCTVSGSKRIWRKSQAATTTTSKATAPGGPDANTAEAETAGGTASEPGSFISGFPKTVRFGSFDVTVREAKVVGSNLEVAITYKELVGQAWYLKDFVYFAPNGQDPTASAKALQVGAGLSVEQVAIFPLGSATSAASILVGEAQYERLSIPLSGPVPIPGGLTEIPAAGSATISLNYCDAKVDLVSAKYGYGTTLAYIHAAQGNGPERHQAQLGKRVLQVRIRFAATTCGSFQTGANVRSSDVRLIAGGATAGPAGGASPNGITRIGNPFEGDFAFEVSADEKNFELEIGVPGKTTARIPIAIP